MLSIDHLPEPSELRRMINTRRKKRHSKDVFMWSDSRFDASMHCHLARKTARANYCLIKGLDDTIWWRDLDNQIVKFTPEEFMDMMLSFDKFIDEIHFDAWREKARLLDDPLPKELEL